MKRMTIFEEAKIVLEKLAAKGFEAFFVGGCVRDAILSADVHDIDIATSAKPEEVMKIFPKTIPVGIEHGTVIVREGGISYEVTTFRTEGEYIDYRRPSSVAFTSSLKSDLARRDFTFNAMAMDADYNVYDPFGGRAALDKKVIQTVGAPEERFSEDPLRIMRAFRFAAKYGFALEEETLTAAADLAVLLKKISSERKRDEMLKLLSYPHATAVLSKMSQLGVLQHLPGLDNVSEPVKYADWPSLQSDAERMALFVMHFSIKDSASFLKEWKLPGAIFKQAENIIYAARQCDLPLSWHVYQSGVETAVSGFRTACAAVAASNAEGIKKLRHAYELLPLKSRSDLPVNGAIVSALTGDTPGPWIGELLQTIEKAVVTETISAREEDVLQFIRRWKDERNPPSHA